MYRQDKKCIIHKSINIDKQLEKNKSISIKPKTRILKFVFHNATRKKKKKNFWKENKETYKIFMHLSSGGFVGSSTLYRPTNERTNGS